MQDFAVTTAQHNPETVVIALRGEIDLNAAPEFQRALNEQVALSPKLIVVDLLHATFLDSTALRVLLEGRRELGERAGEVCIVCQDPTIRKIFAITGLDKLFRFSASVGQAVTATDDTSAPLDIVA